MHYSEGRSASLSLGGQQCRKLVRHAQDRVVTPVELVPSGVELVRGAALMRFAGIGRAAAPDHGRRPLPIPEIVELDRALVDPDRMQGIALERPPARLWVEIGKQPSFRILAGRAGGEPA